MFQIGQQYENRLGKYTVLEINEPRMTVQYEDGTTAELNMAIQHRIWDNIVAEREAKQSRARAMRRSSAMDTRHFIKPISMMVAEELSFPGWKERVGASSTASPQLRPGDRLIYYAIENQVFFAVATITGTSFEPSPRDQLFDKQAEQQMRYFPVDLDSYARNLDKAIPLESVEIESEIDIKGRLNQTGVYIPITEDEFELIAEMLTEYTEEEEEEIEEEEEEEEYED